MILLLDTHAFLWWTSEPEKLTSIALDACNDPGNELLLSLGSVWEMLIKEQLGKLRVRPSVQELVTSEMRANHIALLPIRIEHLWALQGLPMLHRDPFDRLLIAQCLHNKLTLLTADPMPQRYGVTVLWQAT